MTEYDYVAEGFWHPNVKSGQVHDHPGVMNRQLKGSWSVASHRLCELVYTKREIDEPQVQQVAELGGAVGRQASDSCKRGNHDECDGRIYGLEGVLRSCNCRCHE